MTLTKKQCLAELIGTFALVFCGTGAIVINDITNGDVGNLGIAITFGAIVMAMIYSIGHISGAHINPAVTIAFWIAGKFPVKSVLPYILSQFVGAILASILLYLIFPSHGQLGGTIPHDSNIQSFILEIILTFFLMFVIINVSTNGKETGLMAGIAIGAVVALEASFAGPISGASMNPARSLGPALISGNLTHVWIYILAPTIGAIISIFAWKGIKK